MKVKAEIDAGICGFKTIAIVMCDDNQHVTFDINSSCEKIRSLAAAIANREPVDAFQEISPTGEGVVLGAARESHKGGCAACAAVVGIFKAMQVAAGLALPRDIAIKLTKEE